MIATSESMHAPSYYPLMLDLRGRKCVVVGGGEIARRKIDGLLIAGAEVTVVTPTSVAMIAGVRVLQRAFEPQDLYGAWLVIAATDDPQTNARVAEEATARQIWVNVVDDPQRCTAIMPAVVRRGLLCLAISTAGACPVWARRLRDDLAAQYGPEYEKLTELLWEARQVWKARCAHVTPTARKTAWENVLDLPLLDLIRNDRIAEAESAIATRLDQVIGEGATTFHAHSAGETL